MPRVSPRRLSWWTALMAVALSPLHHRVGCDRSAVIALASFLLAGLTLLFALVGKEPFRPRTLVIAAIAVYLNGSAMH